MTPQSTPGTPPPQATPAPPPVAERRGRPRSVGVEIEFGGLSSSEAAAVVAGCFGGEVAEKDPHEHLVGNARFGDFLTKLDSRYAHGDEFPLPSSLDRLDEADRARVGQVAKGTAKAIGDVFSAWMPTEVVCPPVAWPDLPEMDRLAAALREAGARGTREEPWFAFGLQLNPELPSDEADSIRRHVLAYLLSAEWLRDRIGVDLTRNILPFVDRFPRSYVRLLCDPAYRPDLDGLIADYVHHNPTRNRELDMLPAFAHLRPETLARHIADPHIKPRPTFHYRLPNADLGDHPAPVTREWNRWLVVERLAAASDVLADLAESWRANDRRLLSRSWRDLSAPVLEALHPDHA